MLDRIFKNLPTVTKNLLIINALFFILSAILGDNSPIVSSLSLRFPTSEDFRPWQIVTHFFMHAGIGHIFFNMFALLMFGSQLERVWGPKRFLIFYFICAFGSALTHTAYTGYGLNNMSNEISSFEMQPDQEGYVGFIREHAPMDRLRELASAYGKNHWSAQELMRIEQIEVGLSQGQTSPDIVQAAVADMTEWYELQENTPVLGASGAIYGLLLAFGMLFPNVELMLLFFPMPIKAKYFIPGLIALELYLGFNNFSGDNMAHFAHLGGALFGFIVVKFWQKRRDTFY